MNLHRTISTILLTSILALITALAVQYATTPPADAATQRPESKPLAQVRNTIHTRRCVAQVHAGTRQHRWTFCRNLVAGTRIARVPRAWASHPASLELLRRESTWGTDPINESSGACGWFQFLPCPQSPTWLKCWHRVTRAQHAACGWRYIRTTYRTPSRALAYHNAAGSY